MHARPRKLLRDTILALLALGGLSEWLRRAGSTDHLRSPRSVALGVTGSLLIESVLLRYPDQARRLWGRRSVRVGALLGVVGVGRALARRWGTLVAALWWGLVAYLVLVVVVLVRGVNPLVELVNRWVR